MNTVTDAVVTGIASTKELVDEAPFLEEQRMPMMTHRGID
jgi:hypothetical protein